MGQKDEPDTGLQSFLPPATTPSPTPAAPINGASTASLPPAPTPSPPTVAAAVSGGGGGGNPAATLGAPPVSAATGAPPSSASGAVAAATSSLTAEDKAILRSSLSIDTLLAAGSQSIPSPEEAVQDKVHFIFNNLSLQNMTQKVKELLDIVQRQYYAWLAQYIVVKRASIEPNFHHIYLQFLDRLELPQLVLLVLLASYRNIKTLLSSDKITTSQSERTLLKNLGSWVGNLTLAKNKPILHKHLDLKVRVHTPTPASCSLSLPSRILFLVAVALHCIT